jgi:hypothetical protein
MPSNNELQKWSYVVGITTGMILIFATVIAWFNGLAFASDVNDLSSKHDQDVENIKIIIYQKDIDALTLKPKKSDYEKALIELYKDRIEAIKEE